MAVISYTARRNLASGHVAGTDYDIEIDLAKRDRSSKVERTQHRSLSGVGETYLQRIDKIVELLSDWMDEYEVTDEAQPTKLDCFREFLDSVAGGEEFYIDFEGTIAEPVAPVLFELDSPDYREQRDGKRNISIPFAVRRVV